MWILQLNPVTANAERVVPVAHAQTRQELIDFLEAERVEERYEENGFRKAFRSDGPLDMYNPPKEKNGRLESWVDVPAIVDYDEYQRIQREQIKSSTIPV